MVAHEDESIDPWWGAPALYVLAPPWRHGRTTSALAFCRDTGFLGLGWGVGPGPLDWTSYRRRAIVRHGLVHPAVREIHDLPDGSLIWTHDSTGGQYWLARVTGPWQYLYGHAASRAGIHNARAVRIVACDPTVGVPRAIFDQFPSADGTLQRLHDEAAVRHSAGLFRELSDGYDHRSVTIDEILQHHLTDDQMRRLVGRYLRWRHGYGLSPPALRLVQGSWEYVVWQSAGPTAIVRTARGFSIVPRAVELPLAAERVFVFSPTGTYGGHPGPNVTEIEHGDMVAFVRGHPRSLPSRFARWVSG